jgi:hypothetical protein
MMAGDHHQRLTTTWCGSIKPTNGGVSSRTYAVHYRRASPANPWVLDRSGMVLRKVRLFGVGGCCS